MIKDIKDLNQFFKTCRKQGVDEIEFDGIKVKFGELPKHDNGSSNSDSDSDLSGYGTEITPEQLMYYSAGGDQ